MKWYALFHILFVCSTLPLRAQVTIMVTELPDDTPVGEELYAAGSFNSWDPGNAAFILTEIGTDTLALTFTPALGMHEYKFTRGSWATVEGNEFGGFLPNRSFTYDGIADTVWCTILTWEDVGGPVSTASWNVEVMDAAFYLPALDKNRRIWIYLPPDYYTSTNHYKVLYMQDGQNVFDLSTSFAGEWEVDETLNDLFDDGDEGCIVVAIDNGGADRLEEYSPWAMPSYGVTGSGEDYMTCIVETIKPYVDAHYRTKPERAFTGLMGSSMGGLISHFGGMTYPDVFGKLGIFSPSYWVSDSCYLLTESSVHPDPMRIYTIAGNLEGSSMTSGVNNMETNYVENGFGSEEHTAIIHADGQHSEWYWAREFGAAYQWLWEEPTDIDWEEALDFQLYPNPSSGSVYLSWKEGMHFTRIELYNIQGQLLQSFPVKQGAIDVGNFSGILMLRLFSDMETLEYKLVIE